MRNTLLFLENIVITEIKSRYYEKYIALLGEKHHVIMRTILHYYVKISLLRKKITLLRENITLLREKLMLLNL